MLKKMCVLLFTLIVFLAACAQEETDVKTSISLPKWETFIAEPMLEDINYESLQEIAVTDEGILHFHHAGFINVALPAGETNISLSYGWQIDLSKLVPVGKTPSGEVVLSLDTINPPVACLINTKTEAVYLYLNEELYNNLGKHLNSNTFIPMIEGNIDLDSEEIAHLLQIHLGNTAHPEGEFSLDGGYDFSQIRLVHAQCEALQYVIKVGQDNEYIAILTVQNNWNFCEHVR